MRLFSKNSPLLPITSIELLDYDDALSDLKDHYDPNLIQKSRILTLVNLLKVHAEGIPDKETGGRILARLDRLEEELKKKSPRWGVILAGFLALVGFLADLKGLHPNIYGDCYKLGAQIVNALYHEGGVFANKSKTLLLAAPVDNGHRKQPRPEDLPPEVAVLPEQEEDQEGESTH